MLDEKQEAIVKAEAYLEEVRKSADDTEQKLQQLILQYRSINDWAEVFDAANNDEKKMTKRSLGSFCKVVPVSSKR